MNYSILLAVQKPNEPNRSCIGEYDKFVTILKGLTKQNKDLQLLTESCVLLPLNKGLQDVLDVLKALKTLPYSYTILTEDTQWHEATNKV